MATQTVTGEARAPYGTCPVNGRQRRTNAELDTVDEAIITSLATEKPATVRAVYYRVVSAGAVAKTEAGYDLVGRQLLKLRRAGRVPYSWITDGTRLVLKPDSWSRLDEMLADAAVGYRRALWHDQAVEVIVLSEKDAISGVIYPVTAKYDVELGIARGYSSETFTPASPRPSGPTTRCPRSPTSTSSATTIPAASTPGAASSSASAASSHGPMRSSPGLRYSRSRSPSTAYQPGPPKAPTPGPRASTAGPSRSTPSHPRSCAGWSRRPSSSTSIRTPSGSRN